MATRTLGILRAVVAGQAVLLGDLNGFMLLRRMTGGTPQAKIKGMAGVRKLSLFPGDFFGQFYPGLGVAELGTVSSVDRALGWENRRALPDSAEEAVEVPICY